MDNMYFGKNKFIGPLTMILQCGRGGRGTKTIDTLTLPDQSQQKIIVECEHGQREIRWSRRAQLCKKCAVQAGLFNTSPKGRKITWGERISRAKKGVKATEEHKKALSIAQYGVEACDWPGFYPRSAIKALRDSIEYIDFRHRAMQRDNFKCTITGLGGNLEVHHLVSVDKNPDGLFDPLNVVTLLKSVHRVFHSIYGYGENTLSQFEEFKLNQIYNEDDDQ